MSVDYRYKPDKHKFRENPKSIDEMHKEYLAQFKQNHDTLPNKKRRLNELETELSELYNNNDTPINLNVQLMKKSHYLKNNIKRLKNEINNTINYNAEMDYYSRTGDVIFDYYDLTNGELYDKFHDDNLTQSNDRQNTIKVTISDELLAITNANKKRRLKRSVKKRSNKNFDKPEKSVYSLLLGSDEDKDDDTTKNTMCRATLQNEYLIMIDKEYACSKLKINMVKKCKNCNIDKIIIYDQSILSCPKCGESEDIFIESEIPSHRETFNEKPKYPYRRIGHCIEKLNQFLCKGTANVPIEVFTVLDEEVKKHGLDKDMITIKFIERMLKKHKMSDYYENVMYIFSKMTNTPPQTITREEYELILKMFVDANEVYERKFKPGTRKNFLKYTFTLNKIFLTLGKKEHAKYFKLLKSPIKMKEQERIWKQICNEFGWKYYSS